jgi:hypothetical protein
MTKKKKEILIIVSTFLRICRINIARELQELKWFETLKRKTFLPWLILTDQKHVVQSEGFAFGELDNKLQQSKAD